MKNFLLVLLIPVFLIGCDENEKVYDVDAIVTQWKSVGYKSPLYKEVYADCKGDMKKGIAGKESKACRLFIEAKDAIKAVQLSKPLD